MSYYKKFIVKPGAKVRLKDIDPGFRDGYKAEEDVQAALAKNLEKLASLQELLYAEHKCSMLLCLQAMDAGGKDGVIRHVFTAFNPQGCRVASFKQPTAPERDHDFLWRAHRDVPAKGEVVVFNRSHYEDVLVVRVHDLKPKAVWKKHYDQINDFEANLAANGTHILKFFLHISKDEQMQRFKDRLDTPSKNWKISEADYTEREKWGAYRAAFEEALEKCSTDAAPWFVIPANHKWFRNYAISQIMVDYMEGLKMKFPPPSVDADEIRKKYFSKKKKKG